MWECFRFLNYIINNFKIILGATALTLIYPLDLIRIRMAMEME